MLKPCLGTCKEYYSTPQNNQRNLPGGLTKEWGLTRQGRRGLEQSLELRTFPKIALE